jgi:uncharacterized tellurite resistance protein B-like protein
MIGRAPENRADGVIGMDKDNLLGARGRNLEEEFFAQHNQQLLRKLKTEAAQRERREALAKATGISNVELLDKLIELDVNVERAAAFTLVPVVEVAWADGEVQPKEREAILKAAADQGLIPGTVAYELVESWLEHAPDPRLLRVWKEYTAGFVANLTSEQRKALRHDLLHRARAVAEAAGGFLGIGAISKAEREMLEDMEKALA